MTGPQAEEVRLTISITGELVPGDGLWDSGSEDALPLRQGQGSRTRALMK